RFLADVLLKRDAKPLHESELANDSTLVPALMKELKSHYLSYFVDDERTYTVLVAKTGDLYTQNIPVGKNHLENWYSEIMPKYWGKKDAALQTIPDNLPLKLSPFISWLEPLAVQGIIEKGDHICYAPDDYLHLIPFHYIIFLNQPFVDYVSISRIHGAKTLAALLANEGADVETVIQCELKNKVVHFATHGYFPHEDSQKKKMNPYRNSGLVLSAGGKLPNLERIAREEDLDTMLSPEKIISNKINVENSHITLQACVTGLAREGLAGDALGLEWGFLFAKASSLLVTHWNVEADVSADFCISFYNKWLKEDKSRARAWRETVLEFTRKEWDPGQHAAFYWAPFSLTGDWR
ncbi:MAG: CHAT domain-containing protein, partial [Spirochaetia bacterium]